MEQIGAGGADLHATRDPLTNHNQYATRRCGWER